MDAPAILKLINSVTKKWTKQRKAEERITNALGRRRQAMTASHQETTKDIAWEVMEEAYLKASDNGRLPAQARQIMYCARGPIQDRTGEMLNDQYFTQTLLPDYQAENRAQTKDWNINFDSRGNNTEPHTDLMTPLGTLEVSDYLHQIQDHKVPNHVEFGISEKLFPTCGPKHRFGAILFIEKEGFMPLFKAVKLAERYDIAIMSTKGQSVVACRLLVDTLCSGEEGVPLLVLHDFDKAGFSILGMFRRDNRRYTYKNEVTVIDLGLRLEDVKKYKLQSETVIYESDPSKNLKENGATDQEIEFLYQGYRRGQRVELNAFTSADLIEWIETKLKQHGVKKIVPDPETLELAYRRSLESKLINKEIQKNKENILKRVKEAKVPKGLTKAVTRMLKRTPTLSWDQAVAAEVEKHE